MRSIFFFVAASLYVLGIFAGNQNIDLKTQNDKILKIHEEVLSDSDVDDSITNALGKDVRPTLKPFPTLVTLAAPKSTPTPPDDAEEEFDGKIQINKNH